VKRRREWNGQNRGTEAAWKIEPKATVFVEVGELMVDGWWLVGWCLSEVGSGSVSEVDCALAIFWWHWYTAKVLSSHTNRATEWKIVGWSLHS
jgi:hypothetical protein